LCIEHAVHRVQDSVDRKEVVGIIVYSRAQGTLVNYIVASDLN